MKLKDLETELFRLKPNGPIYRYQKDGDTFVVRRLDRNMHVRSKITDLTWDTEVFPLIPVEVQTLVKGDRFVRCVDVLTVLIVRGRNAKQVVFEEEENHREDLISNPLHVYQI
jgi:hypothetical protein